MSVSITIDHVVKKFGENIIIPDLTANIKNGELFTLLGPSGCGKTTLLRMIAGFNSIEGGTIAFGDQVINDVPAYKRNIGMVFQSYAIFPHLTVRRNVEYGLRLRNIPKDEMKKRTDEMLALVHIDEYQDRLPERLSGGQQQRVALARAIVIHPQVLLMDEPLSNLDAKLRNQMRGEIIKLRQRINTTFIYVTHDQAEAMTLGDRIVIMRDGFIQQIGTHQEVFNQPANLFVAGFIGVPQMNFFRNAKLVLEDGKYAVEILGRRFTLTERQQAAMQASKRRPGTIIAGVRPVHIRMEQGCIPVQMEVSEMMGSELHLHLNAGGTEIVAIVPTTGSGNQTREVAINFDVAQIHLFDAETERNVID